MVFSRQFFLLITPKWRNKNFHRLKSPYICCFINLLLKIFSSYFDSVFFCIHLTRYIQIQICSCFYPLTKLFISENMELNTSRSEFIDRFIYIIFTQSFICCQSWGMVLRHMLVEQSEVEPCSTSAQCF